MLNPNKLCFVDHTWATQVRYAGFIRFFFPVLITAILHDIPPSGNSTGKQIVPANFQVWEVHFSPACTNHV